MDKLEFRTTIEDVIRLFGPEGIIYSQDHSVFLRELIQNSMDSIVVFKQTENNPDFAGKIRVSYKDNKITITDNGWGLDREGVTDHFARPLRGIRRYLESNPRGMDYVIGHFGVGFLSVFKVSDYVEIETQRLGRGGVAVNIGLKRAFVRGRNEISLHSFINDTNTGMEHGMKVVVYLGSADSDTQRRSELINSSREVLEALKHYIKHPPGDIDILFEDEHRITTRIEPEQYRGEDMDIHHRIRVDGAEGVLAYSEGLAKPVLQVCQRGLLVKENYPMLLPESCGAIVGEINLLRTDLVDLALSRETFIENEKHEKLKSLLAGEIFEFDRVFKTAMQKRFAQRTEGPKKKYAVREDSQHATSLIEFYNRGIQKNIYHHKICSEVTFYVESEDSQMMLPEIAELAKSKNLPNVHVYEKDMKYLYQYTEFDGVKLFTYEQNRAAAVEYLTQTGEVVIRLTQREEGSKLSFLRIVTEYMQNSGLGVVEVEPGRVIRSVEDFGIKVHNVDVKVVDFKSVLSRRAFVYKYYTMPVLYLNKSHPEMEMLIEESLHVEPGSKKEQMIIAYINLLAGNHMETSVELINLIMAEPRPAPPPQDADTSALEGKPGPDGKDRPAGPIPDFMKKWFKDKH